MPPEAKKLLFDMQEASHLLGEFIAGKTLADMRQNKLLRAGVYYQFTIIGEALSQLRDFDADIADRISESPRIIGFRNQVVHGYGKIVDEVTWKIIQEKLPILIEELTKMLAE